MRASVHSTCDFTLDDSKPRNSTRPIANLWSPLALAVLAPIVLNILAFHVFLAPDGTVIALVLLAFELYLAWAYRAAFRPMLAMRVRPS